jgi:hypothetical protein
MKYVARCISKNTLCSKAIFYLSHEVFFDPNQILSAPRGRSANISTDYLIGTAPTYQAANEDNSSNLRHGADAVYAPLCPEGFP